MQYSYEDCRFAYASDDELAVAQQRFDDLRLADDENDLRIALTRMPLSLPSSAVVLQASRVFLSVLLRFSSVFLKFFLILLRFLIRPSRLASGKLGRRLPPSLH